jgi:NADH-quinone oxidoreductase subunit A
VTAPTAIAIFLLLGVGFAAGILFLGRLVSPNRPTPEKLAAYECGEQPLGQAWSQFNVRFYVFALLFVIFAVEALFLFPWAVRVHHFRNLGVDTALHTLSAASLFILILLFGLIYAWRKGVLKWT